MNNKLDIVVVNTMPFPSGAASVNRILSYSKGLVELGNNVMVYSTSFGEDLNIKEYNGIKYINLRKKTSNKIINKFSLVFSLIRLFRLFLFSKSNHNVIILVTNSLMLIYPLYFISKLKKIKLIQEKSEFPFVLNKKSFLGKIYAKFYINTTYKLFDGMLIMTHPLNEYLKKYINKECKTVIVPMTVEPERFDINTKNVLGKYIAYAGDLGGNKDGVQNLIESFQKIEKEYEGLKLLLIGGSKDPSERKKLENFAQAIKCENVVFYGMASREEIPILLSNAYILALARPSGIQSTGGFPTKLGEYLSTGKPTIVTKVGDIPLYLEDGKNAYLVEPDAIDLFAQKLKYILDNYDKALKVAQEGKALVYKTFNYKIQSKNIELFIRSILN